MNLTREQLRDLLNDHVSGFKFCGGALALADKIIAAETGTPAPDNE